VANLGASKTITRSNISFILQHPSVLISYARGGKTEAYRVALRNLLNRLSKCEESEIEMLLHSSSSSLQVPKDVLQYRNIEFSEFSNIVMLYYLVRVSKPSEIVETGVWSGKTSWTILHALTDNGKGHLTSIDLGKKQCDGIKLPTTEIGGFVPETLRKSWTLKLGDAHELLPETLSKLGAIDMFYHDSNHTYEHMTFEFTTALSCLKKGGIICSDDINMNNAWIDFSQLLKCHYEVDNKFGYGYA